jgi:hypothetical protein
MLFSCSSLADLIAGSLSEQFCAAIPYPHYFAEDLLEFFKNLLSHLYVHFLVLSTPHERPQPKSY